MIMAGYLKIVYDYRLPLIAFTERGWEIEKYAYAREHYEIYRKDRSGNKNRSIALLKSINPDVTVEVLRTIADEGTEKDLPGLEAWAKEAEGKVRKRIFFAINKTSLLHFAGLHVIHFSSSFSRNSAIRSPGISSPSSRKPSIEPYRSSAASKVPLR